MTRRLLAVAILAAGIASSAQEIPAKTLAEAKAAMEKGAAFLLGTQAEDGSWVKDPAITALCAMALAGVKPATPETSAAIEKARLHILANAREDGSIAALKSQYVNYSTAVALCALAAIGNPADKEVIRKGRSYLIGTQLDEDHPAHPTKPDNPFYGGIGYGSAGPERPDLSNTQWALEALKATEGLEADPKADIAWGNALKFLANVQNIPRDAPPGWTADLAKDPRMDGGFVYKPGESKVNDKRAKEGKPVPEEEGQLSYGSMTYAGMKSMIYAKLSKDDVRVKAARAWAARHYTLDENPVMGAEGHFYYLQTFGKANKAYGEPTITVEGGQTRDWRADLLAKCAALQKPDGSWVNERSGRWMESIPELATAYAMLAMGSALP